jgi:ADP-ribose pyrophosphatase YjhB (NUDIX family)
VSILDGWKFCPRCAASTTPVDGRVECPSCGFVAWASSVPAVQALVQRDGKLLLGRRGIEPGRGKWDVPGGFLEEGEEPLEGLRRELREEIGIEVEVGRFLGVWNQPYQGRTALGLTWDARPVGEPRAGDDLVDLAWFAPHELPPDDELAFSSHETLLAAWRDRPSGPAS